jgi:hypothetical protein
MMEIKEAEMPSCSHLALSTFLLKIFINPTRTLPKKERKIKKPINPCSVNIWM